MRYVLDVEHYADDKLLPAGTIVGMPGDEGIHHFWMMPDGKPRPPSKGMTPLDDAAKDEYRKHFGEGTVERDPTAPIPIQGTGSQAKAPGAMPARPAGPSGPARVGSPFDPQSPVQPNSPTMQGQPARVPDPKNQPDSMKVEKK